MGAPARPKPHIFVGVQLPRAYLCWSITKRKHVHRLLYAHNTRIKAAREKKKKQQAKVSQQLRAATTAIGSAMVKSADVGVTVQVLSMNGRYTNQYHETHIQNHEVHGCRKPNCPMSTNGAMRMGVAFAARTRIFLQEMYSRSVLRNTIDMFRFMVLGCLCDADM